MSIIGNAVTFGSGEPELLWINSAPTSAFAAQTLLLSTAYSAYIVEIKATSSSPSYVQVYVPFSEERKRIILEYGSVSYIYYRYVNSAADGTIEFSTGYQVNSGSSTSYAIPIRIWGIKWTI